MFPSRQWPVRLPGWLHPLTNPAAMSTATAPAPETSTGPDVVIGVDTHKHTHMAVALSANGGWLGSLKLEAKRSVPGVNYVGGRFASANCYQSWLSPGNTGFW